MADFNPGTTATKGLQWPVDTESSVTLDAVTKAACMSILQTTAQNIGTVRVWVGEKPTNGGSYELEVYDNETAVPANLATTAYRPNEDVAIGAGWTGVPTNTAGNRYTNIDEAVLDLADYLQYLATSSSAVSSRFRLATAGVLTGKRIHSVTLNAVCEMTAGTDGRLGMELSPSGAVGGVLSAQSLGPGVVTLQRVYTYNEQSGRAWTLADLQALDGAGHFDLQARFPSGSGTLRVYQVWIDVVYMDENRIALGALSGSGVTANAWNAITVTTPTGGTWGKDGAGRHLYLLRRISSTGSIVIPRLANDVAPNPATGFAPTLDPTYGYVTSMGAASAAPYVFGLIQRTTAPAESVDSQPYVLLLEAAVQNGQDAEQEFSNAAAANYKVIAGARVKSNAADADLLVKIKRRSDNVQLGSTLTFTKAEIDALADEGSGWRNLTGRMAAAATLAAATQYYIEFSSASTAPGWSVVALDTGDQGNGATFGGTTDRGLVNGLEADRYDLPVTAQTVPTTPANFAGAQLDQALEVPDDPAGCEVSAIEYAHLTWTATALGGTFLRYEIERSNDGGTTWENIANLTPEATAAFDDYESTRKQGGFSVKYRLRVVRTDGSQSDWSATVSVTIAPQCCEMVFTSNIEPSLNLAYNRPPEIEYKFLSGDAVVLQQLYGVDYQAAFIPTEERGVVFSVPLNVNLVATPAGTGGVSVFAPLRALSRADLPYVSVTDHYGNRFLANLRITTGNEEQPDHIYIGDIVVTQITDTPVSP